MSGRWRSRFGRIESRGPEGRLTEMLALCLLVRPEFATAFASHFTRGHVQITEPHIETEVMTPGGKFIDLELRHSSGSGNRVWIEIKRDLYGESSDEQVQGYIDELSEKCDANQAHGHVIYLPRPDVLDPEPALKSRRVGYTKSDWTELGAWLENRFRADPLLRDFTEYLREELLFVEAIDHDVLSALNNDAHRRFAKLLDVSCERVRRDAARGMGLSDPRLKLSSSKWVMGWGERWHAGESVADPPEGTPGHGQILLEWNLGRRWEGSYEDRIAFAVGLTWYRKQEEPWSTIPRVPELLCDSGKEPFERYLDDLPRLHRWLDPEELLAMDAFEHQVERLTKFVTDGFRCCLDALHRSQVDFASSPR